ncbi:AsmA family protein [Methylomicrobium sp. Wu6]|uniref:AsmA family protein n=1 Tax=Methylomicrobium sp. Wu6 TaxID=3107928 RepID=UPI002DD64587|nr:AsmA family protein [Methylomicrobium sp. Wu6]MEC4749115.1 AsmA family protein [Methylomicrobium sp. Wu6]
MRKTLKVFVIIFGLLILLLVVAVGVLPLVVDPNQFKPQLAEIIKDKTGREVEFAGDLQLSVFPWLGVSTGRIRIKNVQGFQETDLLSIEQGDVKVEVLPLLGKRLEIRRIELKGLRLNLIRNQDGANNWSQAGAKSGEPVEPAAPGQETPDTPLSPEKTLLIFAVGGVTLDDATIHWDDRQVGKRFDVDNINLNIGRFSLDQFANVALKLSVVEPESGYRDNIDFTTRVLVAQNLEKASFADTALKWAREGGKVSGQSVSAVLTAPEIVFEKNAQKIRIGRLQMQSGELSIVSSLTGIDLFKKADVEGSIEIAEFNPGKLLKHFEITLPRFQASDAFSRLQAGFNLHAAQNTLSISALRCKLDDTLLQGDAHIEGLEAPSIRFNLTLDAVDAGRYLSPESKNETKLVSPSAAIAVALSKLPVERLRKLNVQGEVGLQHLKMNGVTADDLRLKLNAGEGVVQTRQDISRLYRGGYSGSVNFNATGREAVMALTEKVENVDIEAFLKVIGSKINLSGALTGSTALQGRGDDPKQIRQGLKGKLDFVLKEGEIRDLKFQKIIDQAIGVLNHTPLPPEQKGLEFSEISGTATLADSVIRSQDLEVKSSRFRIVGSGMTNIETGLVNYRFVANLVKAPATDTEPEKLHGTPIVVDMAGTLDDPDYRLDMAALLTEKNKAKIERFLDKNKGKIDNLKDKLDKKLGPGVGDLLKQLF